MWEGPVHCGRHHAYVSCIRKLAEHKTQKPASNHSSMVSVSVPTWLLAPNSLIDRSWPGSVSQINPFSLSCWLLSDCFVTRIKIKLEHEHLNSKPAYVTFLLKKSQSACHGIKARNSQDQYELSNPPVSCPELFVTHSLVHPVAFL